MISVDVLPLYVFNVVICDDIMGRSPVSLFFFLKDPAPPEISPLPLHDALPIPAAASPSPSRVTVWRGSTILHVSGPITSTTRRRTVLLPTSIAQRRMPIDERPAGSRRGVSRSTPGSLLPLERADVVYDLPALLLREVLPRGHGAPPVRNLPEDLAVALLLYGVGRPVRRLRRWQRRGRGTVAVSARAVTRHAIRLDQLLRIADALHGVLEALRLWRRDPRALRRHPQH